jgi:hypothetical protein
VLRSLGRLAAAESASVRGCFRPGEIALIENIVGENLNNFMTCLGLLNWYFKTGQGTTLRDKI